MEEQELRHRLAVAEGNIAGLVAIIGALVRQLPEEQRLHLEARAEAMFEPLEAAMLGDADPYSDSSLNGLHNVRAMLSDLISRNG
ncbi:hypothetical protein [Bordetella bronchiseptica]|uniref:hypothetical protein n=1 Tax=Bordetella bronchiseptica TaxID=518 RepID=UPI000528911C|nr:hypothetical protein [Bordetella bronchiseptica]VTQ77821.1 Uncharacterised protein [Bordetella bronchiseptica]